MSILGAQNVAISLVLAMILEIHVFSQVRFQWSSFKISMEKSCALVEPKSSKQWKSLCESDNSCFLCFFDCLEFRDKWENHEITHKIISVIFIKFWRSALENQVFQESLWSLYIKHFGGFQGRSHAAAGGIDRIQGCLPRGPWGRPKLRSAILVNWRT